MNPRLSSWLTARLVDRRDGHRREVLAALRERESDRELSEAATRQNQDAALCTLLTQARDHVPFYKDLLPSNHELTPSTARMVLGALPIVSREELQADAERFASSSTAEVDTDSTSGSTGIPFQFRIDRKTRVARESSIYWGDSLAGWRYGDRCAYLWGNQRQIQSLQSGARMRARAWLENHLYLSAYDVSAEALMKYHDRLSRFRPHLLIGYASALEEFARVLREFGVEPDYPVRAVVSSAEVLSPEARTEIESVLGVPAFDRYGCREFGVLAGEDNLHDGLALNERDVILEIDSSDATTEPGRVIVTYLVNTVMPFIRYDIGDVALIQAGPGGRKRIFRVLGRQGEIIKTPQGRSVHGNFFSRLFREDREVRRFEVTQEAAETLQITIAGREDACVVKEDSWRKEIGTVFGTSADIRFEYVERIHPLPSGKRRIVSAVKTDESAFPENTV
jgi:phenylacetate-CoA ligase